MTGWLSKTWKQHPFSVRVLGCMCSSVQASCLCILNITHPKMFYALHPYLQIISFVCCCCWCCCSVCKQKYKQNKNTTSVLNERTCVRVYHLVIAAKNVFLVDCEQAAELDVCIRRMQLSPRFADKNLSRSIVVIFLVNGKLVLHCKRYFTYEQIAVNSFNAKSCFNCPIQLRARFYWRLLNDSVFKLELLKVKYNENL